MSPISSIPATRVADLLVRQQMLSQLQSDQRAILESQTQISTGRRVVLPSDDAPAALQGVQLQELLERKDQVQKNISTGQSYLSAADVALADVSSLLADMRGEGLSVLDTITDDVQREAVAAQVEQAVQELMRIGNQQFRGRYLFAGTDVTVQPFEMTANYVAYFGNEGHVLSFSDLNELFATGVNGQEAFGVISEPVRGSEDLAPILRSETRLSDLRLGLGITQGSVAVSDGTNTSVVDLSRAVTIGDVARLLETHPPTSRSVMVHVTSSGLTIELDAAGGGNLTVTEVGGGTTARELEIYEPVGVLTEPLVGGDLNPRLRLTTPLGDLLGTHAAAMLVSAGANNDIVVSATTNGDPWNDVAIQFVDDALLEAAPGLTAGNERATFDPTARAPRAALALAGLDNDLILTATQPGTDYNNVAIRLVNAGDVKNSPTATYSDVAGVRTLTVGIDDSDETSLAALIGAIEGTGLFAVTSDGSAGEGFDGASPVLTANIGIIGGNTGNSGGAAGTLYVHVQAGVTDANQAVTAINTEGTFQAKIDPHDSAAGPQLGIGPVDLEATATTTGGSGSTLDVDSGMQVTNGGQVHQINLIGVETVEDLLNVLNGSAAGLLAEINQAGTGVDVRSRLSGTDFAIGENGGTTATQLGLRTSSATTALAELNRGRGVDAVDGIDFTIVRNDGVQLDIDVSGALTIGDVVELINGHLDNQDATPVVARLAEFGNGIELVDDNPNGVDAGGQPNRLQVVPAASSRAAVDLGLLGEGHDVGHATQPATPPTAPVWLTGANTDLTLTAAAAGTAYGGVNVELVNNLAVGDQAIVTYLAGSGTLRIDVDPAATRAATILDAVNTEGTFQAELNQTNGPNDGSGLVVDTGTVATLSSGSPEVLTGIDVNPQETKGAFNTLLRLQAAIRANDLPNMRRALEMIEDDIAQVNFTRAEIGVRQQGLDAIASRLQDEQVGLQKALSDEIDVDLAAAISELTALQFSFEASLQASAMTLQLTLLDFL